MSKEWYANEIADMVSKIGRIDFLESIYWFVRTLFGKGGAA